jgi:hypothetical protein
MSIIGRGSTCPSIAGGVEAVVPSNEVDEPSPVVESVYWKAYWENPPGETTLLSMQITVNVPRKPAGAGAALAGELAMVTWEPTGMPTGSNV